MTPDQLIENANRIVVKIGSALVADEQDGSVCQSWLNSVAKDVAALIEQDKEVVIVSSGAIALGRKALGIDYTDRPTSIPLEQKQAAAALGQVELSKAYANSFETHNIKTCLLYTSPSPRDQRGSRMPSSA